MLGQYIPIWVYNRGSYAMGYIMDEPLEDLAEWEEVVITGNIITPYTYNRKQISVCLGLGMGSGEQLLVGWALLQIVKIFWNWLWLLLYNSKEIKITN